MLLITCVCGKNWMLRKLKLAARDEGSLVCSCGEVLKKWDSRYGWAAEAVAARKSKPTL